MLRSVQSRVRVAGRVYHDKDPSEEAEQANVVFLNEGARPFGGASQMDGWVRQERTI